MEIQAILLGRPHADASGVSPRPLLDIVELSDGSAIRRIAVGDHQGNYLETYSTLGYLAASTERVGLGPYVTNIVGRDPGVHAAALASLDALSSGRAYFVLGRGDGAVRNLGLTSSSIGEMAESIETIRALLTAGEAVTESGRRITLRWPSYPVDVPLYLAASGPRMTEVALEVADGLYTAAGLTDERVPALRSRVGEMRPDDDFDVWWVTRFGLGETRHAALSLVREGLSSIGNHALRGSTFESQGVPPELWRPLGEYHRRYDWARKSAANTDGPTNADLMVELGLEDYFLERFGIVGTPPEVVGRIRELEDRGVDKVVINIHTRRELELFVEEVEPHI